MTNPTKLELLKTAILVEWIKDDRNAARRVGSFFFGYYDEEGIAQSEDFASPDEIREALNALEGAELITGYHHEYAESRWFLNESAALEFHTTHIHDQNSLLHRIEKLGHNWVVEVLENIRNREGPVVKEIEVETAAKSMFDPVDDGEVVRDLEGEPVTDDDGVPLIIHDPESENEKSGKKDDALLDASGGPFVLGSSV